jgi:hypothetical protein
VVYDTVSEELTDASGFVTVQEIPVKAYDYAVSRATLEHIPYFRAIFPHRGFRDTGNDYHELHEDDPAAWKIWLQIIHDSLNRDSYEVGIATVWNVLVIADKYQLSPKHEKAKRWFAKWYDISGDPVTVDECSEALYPCHTFDHARGFAFATKRLAYKNEGHVGEKRPEGGQVYHLRLDHRITRMSHPKIGLEPTISLTTHTEQLNAARGRLRTILYRDLYAPVKKMLEDEKNHCQYKEKVLWAYLKALEQTEVWPSERVSHGYSIEKIMKQLSDKFKCTDPHPDGTESCFRCKGNFNIDVKKAIECTRGYFNGLCLGEKQLHNLFNVNTADVLRQTASTAQRRVTRTKITVCVSPLRSVLSCTNSAADTTRAVALLTVSLRGTFLSWEAVRTSTSGSSLRRRTSTDDSDCE